MYHNDSAVLVIGGAWLGCRKPLLTEGAGRSQASKVTAQLRFYCIHINQVPRAGEVSLQHGKSYPRNGRLCLVIHYRF